MWSHRIFVTYILAALGGLATALSPHWNDMRTKHSWSAAPHDWEWVGRPQTGTTIDLHVALKSQQENALIDALYEVSTPGNPKYGEHLSKEQVAKLVAAHPDTLNLVYSWLDYSGVPSSSISFTHGGSSLKLTGVPISQANDFLGTSYQLYRHTQTNETIVRTTGYALPVVLHDLVQTVAPTTCFESPGVRRQKPRKVFGGAAARLEDTAPGEPVTTPSSRDVIDVVAPSFLKWLYSTWVYTPVAVTPPNRRQNMLGIVGYLWNFPSLPDLRLFMRKYRSDGADATFTVVLANNGVYDSSNPGTEANLDMQYAQGLAYPIRHIFYSTGRGPLGTNDWYLSFLGFIINEPIVPQTISLSYGNNETNYPIEYAAYVCGLFGMLGARGVSILQSSGDDGVGPGNCRDRFGNYQFIPTFPGTCPFVTTVGGTMNYQPEVAAPISGGGFSNIFLRPPFQEQVVPTFLQSIGNMYQGFYNPRGRGIPDISAQAKGFRIFFKGVEQPSSGTSGATPIVAAIISLLNDNRLAQGKSPRGFLNPWLYGPARVGFTDIIYGWNPGCNTNGFPALFGWDPVTGLGTPDLEQLLYIDDLSGF